MKRGLLLVWLLMGFCSLRAQDETAKTVADMASVMRSMARYEVDFEVRVPEESMTLTGTLAVEGDRYAIRMGDAEVFGDKQLRHEINHARREVTLMQTETESSNLLSNPSRAFELITGYNAQQVEQKAGREVIALTTPDDPLTKILVTIDRTTHRPQQIRYEMDGAGVDVVILRMAPLNDPLPVYDAARYPNYEVIDFR